MILFDTNLVSELMLPQSNARVAAWVDAHDVEALYLSSISVAELRFGVRRLPVGKRRSALSLALGEALAHFQGRILSFDEPSAEYYARLASAARSKGLGFPLPDAYIAAVAAARGYIVASRDTAPYEAAGIPVINPWQE